MRNIWLFNAGVSRSFYSFRDAEWTLAFLDLMNLGDGRKAQTEWLEFNRDSLLEVDRLLDQYEPERKEKEYPMAYAVEFIVQRLTEQLDKAKTLEMNKKPGGSHESLLNKLKEGINLAGEIPVLKVLNGGSRRYAAYFQAAVDRLETLGPLWEEIAQVRGTQYESGEQREKAIARMAGKSEVIEAVCKDCIAELKKALALLEQGEKAQQVAVK